DAGIRRGCRRFFDDHETHLEGLEPAMRLVNANRYIDNSASSRLLEQLVPIDRLALCAQLQAVPVKTHQHVSSGGKRIPDPIGLRKTPIAQADLARRHLQQIKPLALFRGGNCSINNAGKTRIVTQVKPPDPLAGTFKPTTIDNPYWSRT